MEHRGASFHPLSLRHQPQVPFPHLLHFRFVYFSLQKISRPHHLFLSCPPAEGARLRALLNWWNHSGSKATAAEAPGKQRQVMDIVWDSSHNRTWNRGSNREWIESPIKQSGSLPEVKIPPSFYTCSHSLYFPLVKPTPGTQHRASMHLFVLQQASTCYKTVQFPYLTLCTTLIARSVILRRS